jgi:hypothetical protein
MNIGKMTAGGFVPDTPSVEDIMKSLGQGWDGLGGSGANDELKSNALAKSAQAQEDLRRAYVALFNSPFAAIVLEDLLDQTFRRSSFVAVTPQGPHLSLEQHAIYGLVRSGQNALMTYIAAMILQGQQLPPPETAKTSSKQTKKKG